MNFHFGFKFGVKWCVGFYFDENGYYEHHIDDGNHGLTRGSTSTAKNRGLHLQVVWMDYGFKNNTIIPTNTILNLRALSLKLARDKAITQN